MHKLSPPKIKKFSPAKQRRLDQLLERNAAGKVTANEKAKLKTLVAQAEELMVANSRRIAEFAKSQLPQAPLGAVPVTVWVSPNLTER
jgi:hypothetical protein